MDSTVRGNQPAGPNRWKRAEQWARENPHTAQGKKYLARVDAARQVVDSAPSQVRPRPWEHFTRDWQGNETYKGQTCCLQHAMLKLQLDLGIAGLEPLYEALKPAEPDEWGEMPKPPRSFVRESTGKRRGKCQVCGGSC
jgi:hypothetical protein